MLWGSTSVVLGCPVTFAIVTTAGAPATARWRGVCRTTRPRDPMVQGRSPAGDRREDPAATVGPAPGGRTRTLG
ncbi:hypothetical protein GCM10027615_23360 [Plantactinospora veratri]